MELYELTLAEISRRIADGKVSPVEVTSAFIQRIEQLEPQINAFITFTPEIALAQAEQAEAEIMAGEYHGPFHGMPIALKDLFETKSIRTTAGADFLRDYIPQEDCEVVRRLRQAGAILLGKLNMHEWALGVTNENPHYGDCKNPWNTRYSPGGSSGGSGAALAARMCPVALGTDTGGSIRIPSSLCGISGLKPTFGRVSKRGVIPLSWNLDHVGPMTRNAEDLALTLNVLAGYDEHDPYATYIPSEDYTAKLKGDVRGWRVAYVDADPFFQEADSEVRLAFLEAVETFRQLGAITEPTIIPDARKMGQANGRMTASDAAAYHHQRLAQEPERFGEDVLRRLQWGAETTSTQYILARHQQMLARHWFRQFFSHYDILLTPTTPITAPLLRSEDAVERARQLTRFTGLFNLSGLPAISIPCGFDTQKLPIGLQIIAPHWGEARLLRAVWAYQQATTWHKQTPVL